MLFDGILGHCSFLGTTGYANHSRNFFTALNKISDLPVSIRNFSTGYPHKHPLLDIPFPKNPINIVLEETNHYFYWDQPKGNPYHFDYGDSFKISYNVWESTRQPEPFFSRLLEFDQLWVPSRWQKICSIEQGYPADKIKIIPEGVDVNKYYPITDIVDNKVFTFLLVGRWEHRKSTTEIIRSFLKSFPKEKDVRMICLVDNSFPTDGCKTTEERLNHYNIPHDDRLEFLSFVSEEEYIRILQHCNCFVSCSRAEGFNLPLIEAIACGVPTICSDYGAQLDFADKISTKVRIKSMEKPYQLLGYDNPPGLWAEPDFDDLVEKFREVKENYKKKKERALDGSKIISYVFTWENAAKTANNIINSLTEKHYEISKDFGMNQVEKEIKDVYNYLKSLGKLNNYMEIGTDRGGTMYYLSSLFSGKKISVDLPQAKFGNTDYNVCLRNQKLRNLIDNIHIISGDSHSIEIKEKVDKILEGEKIDVLFIDGDHTYEGVKKDYEMYKDFVKDNGLILFHDINDSQYHREKNCYVGKFWNELNGRKIEFNEKQTWAGIGVLEKVKRDDDFVFVTACDENYIPLTEKLVKSVSKYSNRKIIVYGINCDINYNYDCVIPKRLDLEIKSKNDVWYFKQRSCIDAIESTDFTNLIWIDSDAIVNKNIDNVREYFDELDNYPIPDRHVLDNYSAWRTMDDNVVVQSFNEKLCEYYGVERKGFLLAHASFFIFNKKCKWFFQEIIDMYENLSEDDYHRLCYWNDEGFDNLLRWKYGFQKYLPLSNFETGLCDGDPIDNFKMFFENDGPFTINDWCYISPNKLDVIYFHGQKELKAIDGFFDIIDSYNPVDIWVSNTKKIDITTDKNDSVVDKSTKYSWYVGMYHEIYNHRDYEWIPEMNIEGSKVVVDIGANIGVFSNYAAYKGAEKIYSFEPDSYSFSLLRKNIPNNCYPFNCAITDYNGTIKLYKIPHIGGHTIFHDSESYIETPCFKLDYFFDNGLFDYIDFLKIDTEGSELSILYSIENFDKINKISLEYHNSHFNYDKNKMNDIINFIRNKGFNSYLLHLGTNDAQKMLFFWRI